jgi:hypothetical protein
VNAFVESLPKVVTLIKDRAVYQVYLLRLWRESISEDCPPVWRFSLEDPRSGRRRGFRDFEGLVAFLQAQIEEEGNEDNAD